MDPTPTLLGIPTDTVNAVAGVVTAVAAAVAAIFAARGVTAWRSEMVGRRRAELAEKALVSAYKARDAIKDARRAFVWAGEMEPTEGENPEVAKHSGMAPARRLFRSSDDFGALDAVRYEFQAVFGPLPSDPFREMFEIRRDIILASETLWIYRDDERDETGKPRPEVCDARATAFAMGRKEPDPIKERLEKAVAEIEVLCRPALEARRS